MQEQSVKDLVANLRQVRESKGDEYAQAWKSLPKNEQKLVLNAENVNRSVQLNPESETYEKSHAGSNKSPKESSTEESTQH